MNKDVIYIDVEDDITAIIGKVKASKEKIVALVPPKRVGVLQSAVNLRLIDRMAKADKKHLVLITNNPALIALSANTHIPVAKNLQSKPEIAEIPALSMDDGDDIIDGAELPVGDHAKSADEPIVRVKTMRDDNLENLNIDDEVIGMTAPATVAASGLKKAAKSKSKIKIPNFDSFRKRLFLIILGAVVLIGALVWAFVFAPAATVIITATTTPSAVSSSVKLGGTAATDYKTGIIKSVSQQLKKDATVEFDATGTGKVGTKATGTMNIQNCDGPAFTLPANTVFTSASGLKFTNPSAISVSALSGSASACRSTGVGAGTGSGAVNADTVGSEYNLSPRSYSMSGVSGDVYASGTQMTGGESHDVKIVSADDIERAKGQLIGQSTDTIKKDLVKKFVNGEKVIDSSFTVDRTDATSVPAVGAEAPASGKATLTIPTTYTIYAFPKADLETYLNDSLNSQIKDKNTQRVYSNGIDKVGLSNFKKDGDALSASITATGQIGPKIDENTVKDQVKGKIYGEVQSTLQEINGVQSVDIQFSYFWVRTVPSDTSKIHIEFKIQDEQ
jgi:hypothetical protein